MLADTLGVAVTDDATVPVTLADTDADGVELPAALGVTLGVRL